MLWPTAFERWGAGSGYANSLLIEDVEIEPAMFQELGGYARLYFKVEMFLNWLGTIRWREQR